jgi:hypothetical protein
MKILPTLGCLFALSFSVQAQKTEVLTLGCFHFNFPNLDIVKTAKADQIDVLEPQYQKEIEEIAQKLAVFRPTIIAIERDPEQQGKYDSLYNAYLHDQHKLSRNEEEQLGFRLARLMHLKRLYCVNAWGQDYESLTPLLEGKDSIETKRFMDFFYHNPDSLKYPKISSLFKTRGIRAELLRMNTDSSLTNDLGYYLLGIFKYETPDRKYLGPDFVTGWWFNRNLRIFRNIQRIQAKPDDRILVIFGAGHMNLLNIFFKASPEYTLRHVKEYLGEGR